MIHRRSGANNWIIRAHAHPDHHQILLVSKGGGTLRVDETEWHFEAPALLVIPALSVHAIEFRAGSDGFVITVSTDFLTAAIEGDEALGTAFSGRARCVYNELGKIQSLVDAFQAVAREFVWQAPGRRIAIKAHLQRILITLARLQSASAQEDGSLHRRDSEIVVRYRELVEREFRQQPDLSAVAKALGVTTARLNQACRSVTGKTALTVMHDRLMIEAKRALLYTGMTAAEIAWSMGFADPAYFNRFFSRRAGLSPGAFRASKGLGPNAATARAG
ncbi:helix-turn-helix domain-containing protein [Aliidongia dinghuensis]|uniref:helix-turn-helix domain-containing protein n=1 Tax=Aliidongia dinghuensis TaxID=1867774 RepID=UPI001E42D555|nr:helix-turn-helix domain-containing protein [Aliidongia dinghuensis]